MKLWGVDLALALTAGLAHHNTLAIELVKLEPDLDPTVHHTNMPIAIVIVKTFGEIGWPHVVAIVEGSGVIVDGPIDNGIGTTVYAQNQAELDKLIATLDSIATPWLAERHEQLGVTDATLAVRVMLRRLDPQTSYGIYLSGGRGGHVAARKDRVRWPAAIYIRRVADGIELATSGSSRTIRTIAELTSGFEATELPPIKADVAWSEQFLADLARAKAVAAAVMTQAQGRLLGHRWSLSANHETYFQRGARPYVWVTGEGKWNVAGAAFEGVPGGVHVICAGGYDATFADPPAAEAAIDDVLAGLEKSMTVVTGAGMREGHRYRVKKTMAGANAGEIVTFRGIQDHRFSEVWLFDKGGKDVFSIDDKDLILDALSDYLEPTP